MKLVLAKLRQLCEISAEKFPDAGFAEELSFDDVPAMVLTAVHVEKVLTALARKC